MGWYLGYGDVKQADLSKQQGLATLTTASGDPLCRRVTRALLTDLLPEGSVLVFAFRVTVRPSIVASQIPVGAMQ